MGVGGKRHASPVLPSGKNPGPHFRGGCVGPESGLDRCGEGELLVPTGVRTPYRPDRSELINCPRYRGCYRAINQ